MAAHPPRQHQLSRLFIPPSLNSQQPLMYSDSAPLYSPSLPTSLQTGSFPPFPMHPSNLNPLQTPMQSSFFGPPQPPGAPARLMNSNGGGGGSHSGTMHRQHQSMVQLAAAAGIFPPHQAMIPSMGLQQQNQSSYPLHPLAPHHPHPSLHHHPNHHHPAASIAGGVPMTPLGQGFPGGGMIPGGPFPPPFIPQQNLGGGNKTHNMMGGKRNQSISVGGPPKAVLGGPMKKKVPSLPVVVAAVQVVNQLGKKKVIVNLPKETIKVCERDGGGQDEHGGSDDEGDDDDDHHRNDGVEEKVERQPWARDPLPVGAVPEQPEIEPPELTTIEAYPSDEWRHHIPPTVDVFLPGKSAWDAIKRRIIEEKLERLGVERGSGSTVPHIHAPHARAASISSPADPALLYFKLNKLQQSQNGNNTSASNSLSTSPQPPLALSPSPRSASVLSNGGGSSSSGLGGGGIGIGIPQGPPRFQGGKHSYSLSLAQPPTSSSPIYNPTAAFNPFGPSATLGSDQIFNRTSPGSGLSLSPVGVGVGVGVVGPSRLEMIHAPQGRVPVPTSLVALGPMGMGSRPESRPDFARGFGLDIPEEDEPEEEEAVVRCDDHEEEDDDDDDDDDEHGEDVVEGVSRDVEEGDTVDVDASREDVDEGCAIADIEFNLDSDEGEEEDEDGLSTVGQSRIHSRHVSKLSAALSLVSVGRVVDDSDVLGMSEGQEMVPSRSPIGEVDVDLDVDEDGEAIGEWTGSEDLGSNGGGSDDESIGEFSNPSDEERARQERMQRRMRRRTKRPGSDTPRRIPNFPRPPEVETSFLGADDDIISNPSEEEGSRMPEPSFHPSLGQQEHFSRPGSNLSGHGRPLPPLPHSRASSAQISYHDPALAHSRGPSGSLPLGGLYPRPVPAPTSVDSTSSSLAHRRDSLNPLAKPFVFGVATFGPTTAGAISHARAPSLGKPLNATAQEFKPGGFTFQPPPGVPQLNFAVPRALPAPPAAAAAAAPPVSHSPARATQGREKRQRRGSSLSVDSLDDENQDEDSLDEGKDTMTSFKFPPSAESPKPFRHSAPASPPMNTTTMMMMMGLGKELGQDLGLNQVTKSFTISGMAEEASLPRYPASEGGTVKEELNMSGPIESFETTTIKQAEPEAASELPFPPTARPKRAPIPLDFKHPVSTSTVPAAVFKNLNNDNGEERTRRTVRSRLSSRDIFEHSPRPSLDDLHVPQISQRITRLFTDPGYREVSSPVHDDIFASARRGRRRTSLPPHHGTEEDSMSDMSIGPMNLSRRIEMQQYEQRLEVLLDEKMDGIKVALEELKEKQASLEDAGAGAGGQGQGLSASTEAMISEVVSLFRTQLQDSAARGLEEIQMDARGELDFEVLKDIIEQSHAEVRNQIHRDISEMVLLPGADFKSFAQQLSERTVNAVMSASAQISNHVLSLERSRPSLTSERDAIVDNVVAALTPHLSSLRPEPIDYEGLTMQLTQSVKPHISQLIDLASDKRETAGLIVDRLLPILPSLQSPTPTFDVDDIVGQLTTEMRRIIGPLDAHEIKEQVSDLVVERLDSRLAVRDKAFNVDLVTEKVTESVSGLLNPLQDLKAAIDEMAKSQQQPPVVDTSALRQEILSLLSDLPHKLATATDALGTARDQLKSQQERLPSSLDENPSAKLISKIDDTLASVFDEQKKLVNQNTEFSEFCQDIVKHINALPETLVEATKVLQSVHDDIIVRETSHKDEAEENRRLMNANAELQVNLAKARGAHGQVRVEKDSLTERLRLTESERDRVREKVEEMYAQMTSKSAEAAAMETRNADLEAALSQALERIKSSDVAVQANQERTAGLEKTIQELGNENQQLKTKAHALEMNATFLTREKEALLEDIDSLRKQHVEFSAQQSQWEELRRTNESIEKLTALVSQADREELKDLRRSRDRFKVLEGEHAALQRRLRDAETKAANSERAAASTRQTLSQTQTRAVEWEKRAKDYESDLEDARSRLDQAERSNTELDADLSAARLQLEEKLEERDVDERSANDREQRLRDQVASLEEQVARLQAEADQAKKAAAAAQAQVQAQGSVPTPPTSSTRPRQNGYKRLVGGGSSSNSLARPDSRASMSTINSDARAPTPTAPTQSKKNGNASPQESVWDSIHAPAARRDNPIRLPTTPKARGANAYRGGSYYRPQIPSPTPSNVSAAPTLGGDGWWS